MNSEEAAAEGAKKEELAAELEERVREYETLFGTTGNAGNATKRLKERGLACGLKDTKLRSVVWKVLLEVLPPYVEVREWPDRIQATRKEYDALCDKYCIDPHKLEESSGVFDPLSQDENSPWNKYFQNEELKKEIYRDLERTYPEHEFFQTKETQESLCRALFVYTKDHPECGYRQGMHELLAPMYYVVHTESTAFGRMVAACGSGGDGKGESAAVRELRVILDPRFIEHDSFALFAALMNHADEFFLQSRVPVAPTQPAAAAAQAAEEQLTPVVVRCRKIQHVLLKQKDPELYQHLLRCRIEPQLYAMRWLRLLFGREFHMQDLIVLWDAIFAYGRSLALADYIAVAMLIYIREQLLQMDELTAMKRLLKYPPVEDITLFITMAMELCTPGKVHSGEQLSQQSPLSSSAASSAASAASAASSSSSSGSPQPQQHQPQQPQPQQQQPQQQQQQKPQHRGMLDMLAQAMASTAIRVQTRGGHQQHSKHAQQQAQAQAQAEREAELERLRAQVRTLSDERTHCSARLERVIYTVQQELIASPALAENVAIVNALAELKQLHAMFSGIVDPSCEPNPEPPAMTK